MTMYVSGLALMAPRSQVFHELQKSHPTTNLRWNQMQQSVEERRDMIFSPKGRWLAGASSASYTTGTGMKCGKGVLCVFSATNILPHWTRRLCGYWYGSETRSISFSPDESCLMVLWLNVIHFFNVDSGAEQLRIHFSEYLLHAPDASRSHWAFSNENNFALVLGTGSEELEGSYSYIVAINDGTYSRLYEEFGISDVTYLPGGSLRMTPYGDENGMVTPVVELPLPRSKFDEAIIEHSDTGRFISASGDHTLFALATESGTIIICQQTLDGNILTTELLGHTQEVHAICFSSENNIILSGSEDQTVRVWAAQSGQKQDAWSCIAVLYGHLGTVTSLAFVPGSNNNRFLSQDHGDYFWITTRIWDISAPLEGRKFDVRPVKEGALVQPGWFEDGICLGGWSYNHGPFIFDYPFMLPVEPLGWDVENFRWQEQVINDGEPALVMTLPPLEETNGSKSEPSLRRKVDSDELGNGDSESSQPKKQKLERTVEEISD